MEKFTGKPGQWEGPLKIFADMPMSKAILLAVTVILALLAWHVPEILEILAK